MPKIRIDLDADGELSEDMRISSYPVDEFNKRKRHHYRPLTIGISIATYVLIWILSCYGLHTFLTQPKLFGGVVGCSSPVEGNLIEPADVSNYRVELMKDRHRRQYDVIYAIDKDGKHFCALDYEVIMSPQVSPDGRYFVWSYEDYKRLAHHVFLTDTVLEETTFLVQGQNNEEVDAYWSPKSDVYLLTIERDNTFDFPPEEVFLADAAKGQLKKLNLPNDSVGVVAWSPDGTKVAMSTYNSAGYKPLEIAIFDTEKNTADISLKINDPIDGWDNIAWEDEILYLYGDEQYDDQIRYTRECRIGDENFAADCRELIGE